MRVSSNPDISDLLTRFLKLPISAEREAALRFLIVGLVLIGLMAFRPQGMLGKK